MSLGANYQYAHSIDDAGALGSVGGVGVQNWQNVLGELGNSSLDVRHSVSGTYLYELPFGKDKFWVTTGVGSHILEGISISGNFVRHRRLAQPQLSGFSHQHYVRHRGSDAAQSDRGFRNCRGRLAPPVVQSGSLSGPNQYAGILRLLRQRAA